LNYFLYALGKKIPSIDDPLMYIRRGEPEAALLQAQRPEVRYMWTTVTLYHAAGRKMFRRGKEWAALTVPEPGWQEHSIFDFVPASVTVDRDLRTILDRSGHQGGFRVLRILDVEEYEQAMLSSLRRLLGT
jgi:hypothetical protein